MFGMNRLIGKGIRWGNQRWTGDIKNWITEKKNFNSFVCRAETATLIKAIKVQGRVVAKRAAN